jgi:Ca2+-binding EF-hand superfamily protein
MRPALAALAVLAACAAPEPSRTLPPPPAAFTALDADEDARLSRAEWEGHGEDLFTALDRDASGDLTQEELAAGFDRLDVDGDGVLSEAEVQGAGVDGDGDGRITLAEWRNLRLTPGFDADGDGKVSREEFSRRRTGSFSALDRNRDGHVSRVELAENAPGFTLLRF